MRFRTPHRVTACFFAATVFVASGCAPYGNRYSPIGYGPTGGPGYPQTGYPQPGSPGGYLPVNYPGGNPPIVWNPGSPSPTTPFPGNPWPPETPVVLKPVPNPTPEPSPTPTPTPTNPTTPTTPTIPVSNPIPVPTTPPADVTAKWVPWPLPQQRAAIAQNKKVENQVAAAQARGLPHTAATYPESPAAEKYEAAATDAPDSERRVNGTNSTPAQDLRYRGGKTIQNMSYVNLYVGGEAAGWKLDEVEKIDTSLEAALTDTNLNYVLMQYFNNQPIVTTARPSHPLVGYRPAVVSRGDIQHYISNLADQGYLNSYDLPNTIFNFLLPPGTILNDEDQPANAAYTGADRLSKPIIESDEAGDSTGGLGGYHGSLHHKNRTLYYSVEVYSERRADGFTNGIPVFPEPWKNLCATLYHEICEYRTDPDVEDAIRDPYNPASERFLGWTSDAGEEIGDYPLHAGVTLKDIVTEVPLANGKGTVPVQFNYSNAAHGPEGPVTAPLPAAAR